MRVQISVLLAASTCFVAWADAAPTGESELADTCEFHSVSKAQRFGWEALPGAILTTVGPGKIGASALRMDPGPKPQEYMGVGLTHDIDLTGAGPGDKVILFVKQNFGRNICVNLSTTKGNAYRYANLKPEQWTRVELDLDLANWSQAGNKPVDAWPKVTYLHIYSKGFDKPGETMLLDGFAVFVKGKPAVTRPGPAPAQR